MYRDCCQYIAGTQRTPKVFSVGSDNLIKNLKLIYYGHTNLKMFIKHIRQFVLLIFMVTVLLYTHINKIQCHFKNAYLLIQVSFYSESTSYIITIITTQNLMIMTVIWAFFWTPSNR